MSKKKVLLRGVFINRDTNGEGVLKVGTTLIRVSTVVGILYQKMKREIIIDNVTEKKYCKKNKYDRWLTNDIILKISKDKLYIYVPKIYERYFYNN